MGAKRIRICSSKELSELRLTEMVGMAGIIVEELIFNERISKGYMVKLDEPYMEEELWFIPHKSIRNAE